MKRSMKNFKRLSAKQIKTYATVVLISTMSLQALGWVSEKEASPNAGMTSSYEMKLDNELVIENWMVTPFFSDIDMESTLSLTSTLMSFLSIPGSSAFTTKWPFSS